MTATVEALATKVCHRCHETKPLADFYADRRRGDGRKATCKECERSTPDPATSLDAIKLPERASVSLSASLPWDDGPWGDAAVEFVRTYPDEANWRWMHVPANGDWYSLRLSARIGDVTVELDGAGGWTAQEANALTAQFRIVRSKNGAMESRTPAPFAYERRGL